MSLGPTSPWTAAYGVESGSVNVTSLKANNTNNFQTLKKVIDGSIVSYWSSNSANSWILLGMEKETKVSAVDVAWKNGASRSYNFVISASIDGKTFTNVYQGASSKKTNSFEHYDFADVPARYLKIIVSGNSVDQGAKISEVKIAKAAEAPSSPGTESGEVGVWFHTFDFPAIDNSMIDNLLQRHINTIYFSTQIAGWDDAKKAGQYNAFIDYALSKGMKVYAVVMDDPTYVLMTEKELTDVFGGWIDKISTKTNGKIDTFAVDVEPHSIHLSYPGQYPSYIGNEKFYLQKYVDMSRVLRKVADSRGATYIDTVPPSYHSKMIEVGISGGLNALSSHSVCVMAYQAPIEKILNATNKILKEVTTKKIIMTIKVTPGYGDPTLEGQEIPEAITTLKQMGLPIGMWSAADVMKTPSNLFPS